MQDQTTRNQTLYAREKHYRCIRRRGELARKDASWRHGSTIFRSLEKLCSLPEGITLNDMRANPILQNAGFVRANMQGIGHRVTGEVWRELYRLLIARSPDLAEKISAYAP